MPHYGAWQSSRIGGGGYQLNISFTSTPGVLYMHTDVGGFYRSDDDARSWRMLHGALPTTLGNNEIRGISPDPRNPDQLLVATGSHWSPTRDGIFLSRDGGKSVQQVKQAQFAGNSESRYTGLVFARDGRNPDIVLAGTMGDGVLRSPDAGATWSHVGVDNQDITDIKFDCRNNSVAWLCSQPYKGPLRGDTADFPGGFFRSADSGATWTQVSPESPSEIVQPSFDPDRLVGIRDHRLIVSSTNGGATWQSYHDGLPSPSPDAPGPADPASFSALAAGPDFLLVGSGDGTIYIRRKGQAAWSVIPRREVRKPSYVHLRVPGEGGWVHFGRAMSSINIDPRNPSRWLFTDWYGTWETRDAGLSYDSRIEGVELTVIHQLAQDPSDPGLLHMGMADNGYHRSIDGGISFAPVDRVITSNVKDIAVDRDQPEKVYALGPKHPGQWLSNQVFISHDRGVTWSASPMTGLPQDPASRCNTIVAAPSGRVLLTVSGDVRPGGGGIYESTDGGITWRWAGEGLPGTSIFRSEIWQVGRELAVSPDGSMICFSHDQGGVFRRNAGDSSWTQTDLHVRCYSVAADPYTPGRFLLARSSGLELSTDAGRTWKRVLDGREARHVTFDAAVKGRVAVATRGAVLLSTDGGASWTPLDPALPDRTINPLAFAGERLAVGTAGSGVFWIPLSPKGTNPVAATPDPIPAPSNATTPDRTLSLLLNPGFEEGGTTPTGWTHTWTGRGAAEVTRDLACAAPEGKAALRLRSTAPDTNSSVYQDITLPQSVTLHVRAKSAGTFKTAMVAVQFFDASGAQVGWTTIADALSASDWRDFSQQVDRPASATRAALVIVIDGDGSLWVDDLRATAP